ncbi:MAG: pyridoxal phosphate-dependent aminotransferase [Erysipelotrichaceae bacterium]|nr:pyridoxal phosphate-dependent aminotransferase [Erysipelotrichaceae bacterium]
MINQQYKDMLNARSPIRSFSEYATKRAQEIGYENVFDYSLGNPSQPVPNAYTEHTIDVLNNIPSNELHGYSPTLGLPSYKEKIAQSLNKRFGINYKAEHIFPTAGAASAIAHAMRAVSKPGDEIITFAPYFLEYQLYTAPTGAKLVVVDADTSSFQINFDQFEQLINEKTSAVLINTPNNPSGAVYSEETIKKLAHILELKQKEYNHEIFIISDEPYREIVFDNKTVPYVAKYYDNTLTCYSYSKSLSLPGERIGYVAVNPNAKDSEYLVPMMGQISRGLGHNNPSALIMRGVEDVCDITCDMSVYETNMNLIYDKLIELGFEVIRPGGTFYIFPKALEEDANAFCQKALKYDLIFVPSDAFGVKGYFRMAYCIDTDKVKRSLKALERFVKEEY